MIYTIYIYWLNDTELEFVKSETDLSVSVTLTLNYNEHNGKLYSKASSRFGQLKSARHFVNNQKQKRALYLAIDHCKKYICTM